MPMRFQVSILGCGSALPTLNRGSSAQVVNVNEQYYLVDCGEGTQLQLRRFKIKFQRINHIFISHLHGDHYLGLVGYLSSLHLLGRERELHVYGPSELEEVVNLQLKVAQTYLRYPLHFHPLQFQNKEVVLETKTLMVVSFPLAHRIPCCGFLFREKPREPNIIKEKIKELAIPIAAIQGIKQGADFTTADGRVVPHAELVIQPMPPRSYAYCSDTKYKESTAEYVRDVDLLYHEATFPHSMKARARETYHSTALQAAKVAKEAGAKQLIIGHFSARFPNAEEFLTEAEKEFSNTVLAYDGLVAEVPVN